MSTSTAPAAITQLIALISAQSAAQSTDNFTFGIRQGEPVHDWPVDDGMFISQVNRQITKAEMRGQVAGGMREDFVLLVNIGVFRGGDNVTDVEARAWALINAVETAVSTNRSLNSTVVDAWAESSTVSSEWDTEAEGRRALATVGVHCWSFI